MGRPYLFYPAHYDTPCVTSVGCGWMHIYISKAVLAMHATRNYLSLNEDFYSPQAFLINYFSGTKNCVRNLL
jgi:hypothetical protein